MSRDAVLHWHHPRSIPASFIPEVSAVDGIPLHHPHIGLEDKSGLKAYGEQVLTHSSARPTGPGGGRLNFATEAAIDCNLHFATFSKPRRATRVAQSHTPRTHALKTHPEAHRCINHLSSVSVSAGVDAHNVYVWSWAYPGARAGPRADVGLNLMRKDRVVLGALGCG